MLALVLRSLRGLFALPDLPVGLLALLGVAVSIFPRQAECWRWWVLGSAVLLFVLYLALVAKGRAADAKRHDTIVRDLGTAKASLVRIEAKRDLAPAAVFDRARRVRDELISLEDQAKTAGEWTSVQIAYWALRSALSDALNDFAVYDVTDGWLWAMRPELPLSDRGRLHAISTKFEALVKRFQELERPRL